MSKTITIGILAFQGAFAEHDFALKKVAAILEQDGRRTVSMETRAVRRADDVTGLDGLILPGGESTTMSKFLERNNFKETLDSWMKGSNGRRPVVWGTCAGLILLANRVADMKLGGQLTLGGMDITAKRNMYGRQNESFETQVTLVNDAINCGSDSENEKHYQGVFIRAPGIASVDGSDVRVMAVLERDSGDKTPVAAEQNNYIVTSFHPELTEDLRWHKYFVKRVLTNVGPE